MVGTLATALAVTSCVNPYAGPNQQNGAVVGAVGGGLLGAMIGNQSGRPLEGAAIGGLLGSLAGAQIGASRDQRYYYNGWNRHHSVRGRPVYVRRNGWSGYPYGRTGGGIRYGSTWHAPYRTGMVVNSFGRPAFGYGSGWGYSPYCW